jgi:hypothetical protein
VLRLASVTPLREPFFCTGYFLTVFAVFASAFAAFAFASLYNANAFARASVAVAATRFRVSGDAVASPKVRGGLS